MHETALVAGVMRIVAEEAARHGVDRVTRVTLRVGLLAAVEERTMKGCFELYAEGTCAEGAELIIETPELRGVCRACGQEFTLRRRRFVCPHCGAVELDLDGGNEMLITAIEAQPMEESKP